MAQVKKKPFTDQELETLKGHMGGWYLSNDVLSRLFNRLALAEAFIAAAWLGHPHKSLDDIYHAWQKSKGNDF